MQAAGPVTIRQELAEGRNMTTSARWTFISNHGLVLSFIFHNRPCTAREIASHVGVTERTTHKTLANLENEGYIRRRRSGRRNAYHVDPSMSLRHHTKQDILVSELLKVLTEREPMSSRTEVA